MLTQDARVSEPWRPRVGDRLSAADLQAVVDGVAPALVVHDYLSPERCALALDAVKAQGLADYEGRESHVQRIGAPRVEYLSAKSAYFSAAARSNEALREIFASCGNIVDDLLGSLARVWPHRVGVACEPSEWNRPYGVGVIRRITTALPHVDWAPMDGGDWAVAGLSAQLALNVFLQVPEEAGGDTIVYRRPWTPDLEEHRQPGSYWYRPESLEGVERAVVRPRAGDLMIFSSRNVHEVRPVSASVADRLTLSSFCAVMPNTSELLLFS